MTLLNCIFFLPEIFYLLGFFSFLLYPAVIYYSNWRSVLMNCTFILVYGAVLYAYLLITNGNIEVALMTFHMCSDFFVVSIKLILCVLYVVVLLLLHMYFKLYKQGAPEPFLLLTIFFIGSCFCLMSNDFFFFFLTMELITIISYLLAATHKFSMFAAESSLKYFILGAMSSSFLLLGFILLYGFTGLTNFLDFSFLFNLGLDSTFFSFSIMVCLMLIISGFLFKLSVVPFHIWVPDVYEGLTFPIVLLFSTLTKVVFIFVFCKILWFVFFEFYWLWEYVLFLAGILSIFLGSVAGLLQNSVVRLYAYSTIVNGGFFSCLLGLGSLGGLVYLWNYLFIYVFTAIGLFFALQVLQGVKNKNFLYTHGIIYLSDLFQRGKNVSMLVVFLLVIIFFSYVGIPPLAGFLAKFYFLFALYMHPSFFFFFLVVLFLTIITSVYYVRVVYLVTFFSGKPVEFNSILTRGCAFLLVFSWLFLIFFFFLQPFVLILLEGLVFGLFI